MSATLSLSPHCLPADTLMQRTPVLGGIEDINWKKTEEGEEEEEERKGQVSGIKMAMKKVQEIVSTSPIVVFSKTYCGYCKRVKQLFEQLGAVSRIIELNEESDGFEMQSALAEWTGQRTVPNVFIAGKHIGGADVVIEKHQSGTLLPLLMEAGAIANNSALLDVM